VSRTALDTSVLVAAIQSWHTEHERALRAVGEALEGEVVVVPLHVLLESYSVLTRMPKPLRLSPETALDLLARTVRDKAEVVELDGESAFELVGTFPERDISGGAVYDAVIAEAAVRAGASILLTLNRRDFERIAPPGLEIVQP
jgi:predicted nucleic acid-binding protein